MTSSVFQALSNQRIETFRASFKALSRELFFDSVIGRLRHSAEFGVYRERICVDFLRGYLPSYLRVGSGFLINTNNEVSTQCDLIVFDPQFTPTLEDAENRRFFPVESVVAIGEVKSILDKVQFLSALVKLAEAKKLRVHSNQGIVRRSSGILFEEGGHHYDEAVSFLICEKLSFDLGNITAEISRHYDKNNIEPKNRHNLVLSIEDGVFCYKNHLLGRDVAWMYPWTRREPMKNRLVKPGDNTRNHFGIFTSYLFLLCSNATIYLPHLADYDVPPTMGEYQDET